MTKNFDDLNDTFNVSDEIVKAEVVKKELDNVKPGSDDIKKDYEYTRQISTSSLEMRNYLLDPRLVIRLPLTEEEIIQKQRSMLLEQKSRELTTQKQLYQVLVQSV